jgi:hypothetical protein
VSGPAFEKLLLERFIHGNVGDANTARQSVLMKALSIRPPGMY